MLLRFEHDRDLYNDLVSKLKRVSRRVPVHADVFRRGGEVYVLAIDDGFSCAFLLSAYVRAKEKSLKASLMYARFIDESFLPEEVVKLARKWAHGKLSWEEIERLKKTSVTEHVFSKW